MAEIFPFHGIHYNPSVVGDPARVICPPYDIIPPSMQQTLYDRHDKNFIRIEFGKEYPQDKDTDNRYIRAAHTLTSWLEQKVLVRDDKPAFYVNDHYFEIAGQVFSRRALNCIIKLEEWESKVVRPHEGILSKAKSDRLNMLYALQANTSPIMGLYEDPHNIVKKALSAWTNNTPLLKADMGDGEKHLLWAISDAKAVSMISGALLEMPVYIADGHHRYESALTYQRERRSRITTPKGSEKFDYVMMTLIDFHDPGLVILPAHRMVRGISGNAIDNLKNGLSDFFSIEKIQTSTEAASQQVKQSLGNNDEIKLVIAGVEADTLYVLTVKDFNLVIPMMPYFHTEAYQKLDVSILDHVILEDLLGISPDMVGNHVAYTVDIAEALKKVQDDEYQMAVFVNPVKPSAIREIADNGDRMPRKSTYFYPKIPAGLVVYQFS